MPLLTLSTPSLSERGARALVFEDPRSQALLDKIRRVAGSEAPVLLLGEPGTGRELLARYLHDLSLRRNGPFLTIDCGAFGAQALEVELFGQERDAYPGRGPARSGLLENASGGTIFLEGLTEIGEGTQLKLLRALQEQRLRRLGARCYRDMDARVIVAGAPVLELAIAGKAIRADLWRMLSMQRIEVAPLRERPRDILPLARHFLQVYQQRIGIGSRALDVEAEAVLLAHPFPGNIRELENAIHRAILRSRGRFISKVDLSLDGTSEPDAGDPWREFEPMLRKLFEWSPPHLHKLIDEAVFRSAYRYSGYNQLKTARILGMSRNVVRARLVQYGELASQTHTSSRGPESPPTKLRVRPRARPVVRFGYQRVGVLGLLRARGTLEAAFADVGYGVEWHHYPSGVRLISSFRDRGLCLGVVGECPPIFAHATSVPVVYVATEAPSPEGVAILVLPDSPIRSVAGLRKRRVAVTSQGSNSHYFLIRALEEAGVDYGDVVVKFLFPNAARLAFQHREVDAWAIADPSLAEVQQSQAVRVLRDGRGLAINQEYYLANRDFAEAHPELIQIFQRELANAQHWVGQHLDDAAESLAPPFGMAEEATNLFLKRKLSQKLGTRELVASQQRIADAFFGLRMIPRAVSIPQAAWLLDR